MSDARELALLDTLATGIPAAFQAIPELHALLVLKGVQLLRRGMAPLAGFFYEQYASVHLIATGDREHAFRFGRLGMDLATRGGNPASQGQVHFLFGSFEAAQKSGQPWPDFWRAELGSTWALFSWRSPTSLPRRGPACGGPRSCAVVVAPIRARRCSS